MSDLHIIYIPGFGDHYDAMRRPLFYCWRMYGISTEFVPMNWRSEESYTDKLARIDGAIDRAKGKRVVLIGESAGGSMVVATHAKRYSELHQSMTISGKNRHGATVAPRFYRKYIAFCDAMGAVDAATSNFNDEALRKFVSFYPLFDGVIPIQDTSIPGVRVIRLYSIGHLFTIFMALTIFSGYIVRVARRSR